MSDDKEPIEQTSRATEPAYEAPAIEDTITPEEMEREVHYAGDGTVQIG